MNSVQPSVDYGSLVNSQRAFFNSNATKSLAFRVEQLQKFESAIRANEPLLYEAIYKDFGKSEFDTYSNELALVYHDIHRALKHIRSWSSVKPVSTNFINFPASSYVIPEPLGVSLIIGAWNYPYLLSLAPMVPAIAAGNTVILKPSELPANTSAAMAKVIADAFDSNYIATVEGGVEETTALLREKFDKIFFTGSVPVGKIIYKAAAEQLTPVTLELGGKSPAFITEDSNLKMTVKRLVWAKFLNAGQTCIAPDYALVHKSIEQRFLTMVVEEIKRARFSIENGNYVQIINLKNYDRLQQLISDSKIHYQGEGIRDQRIFPPTLLSEVGFDDPIMKEEIFGPILPVIAYDQLDDVVQKVKTLPKPLSCYIFTKNARKRKKVLHELSFGGGAVNEAVMHITNDQLPFGGVGHSGIGNYHGEDGFKAFSHFKGVLDKPTWFETNLKYFPQSPLKLSLIKRVFSW